MSLVKTFVLPVLPINLKKLSFDGYGPLPDGTRCPINPFVINGNMQVGRGFENTPSKCAF
jgi:hypothetical protein